MYIYILGLLRIKIILNNTQRLWIFECRFIFKWHDNKFLFKVNIYKIWDLQWMICKKIVNNITYFPLFY